MKKILLVDGNALIFRAYFATAYSNNSIQLKTKDGIPTNAVFSFAKMLKNLIHSSEYYNVIVAFDKGKKTFRHEKLESYKAGRSKTPDDLIQQFKIVREFLDAANIVYYEKDNYEADDIIAVLTQKLKAEYHIDILSSDKDLFQLIDKNVHVLTSKSGTSNLIVYDIETLKENMEITPEQVVDYKGLSGDPSDNLPGVRGIGPKTAKTLLAKYGHLDNIYENIEEISKSQKEKLLTYKDDAYLSKEMAVLNYDFDISDYQEQTELVVNYEGLNDFYEKYEMASLMSGTVKKTAEVKYQIIDKWTLDMNHDSAIYLQTLDENYHKSEIIGFGISNSSGNYYYDFSVAKNDILFKEFLASTKFQKSVFDLKKIICALNRYEIKVENIAYDMMLASYIFNEKTNNDIQSYISSFLKVNILEDEEVFGKGVKKTSDVEKEKIAKLLTNKSYYMFNLKDKIINLLIQSNQHDLYENLEMPVAFALTSMEINGIFVDRKELTKQQKETVIKVEQIAEEIQKIAKNKINPNSPKQIQELLYDELNLKTSDEKVNKKRSTSVDVLEFMKKYQEHPVIDLILEYRKFNKILTSFLNVFESSVHEDNKIHTIYRQADTTTGRISSKDPNMQVVGSKGPEQRKMRKIFTTSTKDSVLLSFDYSQIELRVLAHFSQDENLIEAFANNQDVHIQTASKIFDVDIKDVDENMRRNAKTINFAIIYGMDDWTLSNVLNITVKSAKAFKESYFERFSGVKTFIEKMQLFAEENGYVKTLFERKRYIPEMKSNNHHLRSFGKRAAVNSPIQGTAADIIKFAIKNVDFNLKEFMPSAKIIAQIHDELIFEVPKDLEEKAIEIIKDGMEKAVVLDVPLSVSYKSGLNWLEIK
ncbi:DNA polymerase I [Spiroplasma endosymbiont of Anurida maritima]|uniref:DNA polymerase I n=1 Tax=Spiroplasma endosymbiont of Anurida maritima TaxID=2967972 RepID=UPI0036D278B2